MEPHHHGVTVRLHLTTIIDSSQMKEAIMVKFGLRVSEFAMDGSPAARQLQQAGSMLAAGRGRFASAWISDHFLPWAEQVGAAADNLEGWTALTYLAGQHPDYTFGN